MTIVMTHARESLFIMDGATTTFGKQNRISISRNFAIFIVLLFIGCLITTGLLVYKFTSCTTTSSSTNSDKPEVLAHNPSLQITDAPSTEDASISVTDLVPDTTTPEELTTVAASTVHDVRLPRSIIPHSYEIKLIPFIYEGNFTFHGEVVILVNVTETTDNITLHANDLTIDESSVVVSKVLDNLENSTEEKVNVREIKNDTIRQFLIVHLGEELLADSQYNIEIKFVGNLNDLLQGFYRSSYKDGEETRWIAATQFQPTDARRAFPCFDEPALKAKFKISIARPKSMSTISNMPKKSTSEFSELPNYVWDHFEESVPMSTYLVAFVVSDFTYLTNGTFTVWSRKNAYHQSKFALQIGPAILKHYEDFFGIKFPLPKIDMIALPDFSAGAMENWGLITYRESVLLFEEGVSSKWSLQNIAIVVAHELAHQWFGNLVTPSWWTDLWLNEGFASYLEYIGTNAVKPEWKVMDQFVINDLQQVFSLDALKSSHQISIVVNNPDEINNIFDRISYAKGATIIRMMDHFLTTDVFKKGLCNYLKSRMYGSAEQDDLWAALTEQAHKVNIFDTSVSVKQIMDTWTLQIGYPVVTAIRNYETNSVKFTQERFLIEGSDNSTNSSLWWIPVTYTNKNNIQMSVWMKQEEEVTVEDAKTLPNDWFLVNVNQTGYYRVNYDDKNWQLLIGQLNKDHQKIDPKNRAQLLDDALNLASAGYLSYDVALNLTKYLVKEKEYVPWIAAFNELDYLNSMLIKTAHFDKYKQFMLNLTTNLYNYIGFTASESDPQLKVYTRMELLWRSCRLGNPDCIKNAVHQYQNWRVSPSPERINPIMPDIKTVVYCNAIKAGGQEEWDFAWRQYKKANVGSEREIILTALGCTRETWLLSRYLEWAVTENSGIRKQDASRVFAAVSNNIIGHDLTYKFLKNNWDRVRKYVGANFPSLSAIIKVSTDGFNTRQEVDDLKMFAKHHKEELGVALKTVQQSIEKGEANIRWMERNFNSIVSWLTNVNISS